MSNESYEQRIIRKSTERGDFVKDETGYYVFWPKKSQGFFSEHDLRIIAEHLSILNKEWDAQVTKDLKELKEKRI